MDVISNLLNANKQQQHLLQLSSSQAQQNGPNKQILNKLLNGVGKLNEEEASNLLMTNLDFMTNESNQSATANCRSNKVNTNINNNHLNSNHMGNNADEEMSTEDSPKHNGQQEQQDLDTEDALKEFAFLSNESSSDELSASSNETDDWNVNKAQLNKLTEQYKRDCKSVKAARQQQQNQLFSTQILANSQRPNRETLQAMITNLSEPSSETKSAKSYDNDLTSPLSTSSSSSSSSGSPSNKLDNYTFTSANSKMAFTMDEDSENNLGELSRISLNNSSMNVSGVNDETMTDASERKIINSKFSLRGHFDAVRCLAFHPHESVLLTGSEDQTIKLWNLDKSSISHKKLV